LTIRTAINARALHDNLNAVQDAETPAGLAMVGVLDAMFTAVRRSLAEHGLTMPNDDGWTETEAVMFDTIRRKNPGAFA
jgi:hypothetical protein